jgi:uncharacterized protein YndB with AHSA1/START domain
METQGLMNETRPAGERPSLTVNRRIKASPAKVFKALTDPAIVGQWFGEGAADSKTIEIDLKVGGKYHFGFTGRDGSKNDVMGVFREVSPPERLVYSWAWKSTPERESLVTIEVRPDGDGSMLSLTHENFFDADARDRHNMGWGYGLDALTALLEG